MIFHFLPCKKVINSYSNFYPICSREVTELRQAWQGQKRSSPTKANRVSSAEYVSGRDNIRVT